MDAKTYAIFKNISSGSGGGTTDHSQLSNRDAADQHPVSAIAGLQTALNGKQEKLTAGDNITIVDNVISAAGGGGGGTVNNFYNSAPVTGKYSMLDGVAIVADKVINASGVEIDKNPGLEYGRTDFIAVEKDVTYIFSGKGYALYNSSKEWLSGAYNDNDTIYEFTASVDGYVIISGDKYMNGISSTSTTSNYYARLCKKEDAEKTFEDYLPKKSAFYDHRIPCNVQVFGDSNTEGYGLPDTGTSWAGKLSNIIDGLKTTIKTRPINWSVFSNYYSGYPKLKTYGMIMMSAYTNKFVIRGSYITAVSVYIDDVEQTDMTSSDATYNVPLGYHKLKLVGKTGSNNVIESIEVSKIYSFTNSAVFGTHASRLEQIAVTGNVLLIMYGTNGRENENAAQEQGVDIEKFIKRAIATTGAEAFVITPPYCSATKDASYAVSMANITQQLPDVNYIDIWTPMLIVSQLTDQSLTQSDGLHISQLGHNMICAVVAGALHIAAPISVFS